MQGWGLWGAVEAVGRCLFAVLPCALSAHALLLLTCGHTNKEPACCASNCCSWVDACTAESQAYGAASQPPPAQGELAAHVYNAVRHAGPGQL